MKHVDNQIQSLKGKNNIIFMTLNLKFVNIILESFGYHNIGLYIYSIYNN